MALRSRDLTQLAQKNVAQQMGHAIGLASLHTAQLKQLDHHFVQLGASNAKLLHR